MLDQQGDRDLVQVGGADEQYTYLVDGTNKTVSLVTGIQTKATIGGAESISSITPMNHQNVIQDWDYWSHYFENCGTVYNDHYSAGLSIEAGKSLDEYPSGVLEGALCAILASRGGKYAAALAAIVCFSIGYFFLDHVSLQGTELTVGAWDGDSYHAPWVTTGVALYPTDDIPLPLKGQTIYGPHLSLGGDISDYL